ncbi:MAG TPA: hypothetical protein VFZ35_01475 [Sphingomicrobium sp.]
MLKSLAVLAGAAVLAAPGAASAQQAAPRLAIVINVDGLTTDLFFRHRQHFTGGLARMGRGVVYADAAVTADPTTGLAAALGADSVTVKVSGAAPGDGRGAFGQAWSWDGRRFVGNPPSSPSRVMPVANEAIARLVATEEAPLAPPVACAGTSESPRFGRAAGDVAAFAMSPAMDGATLAVSAGLIGELAMGTDAMPDLIAIDLPATGHATRAFGPGSQASCLQLLSLDSDLAGFFSQLDRGGIDYVVALTGSAQAGVKAPLLFWRAGMTPAVRQDPVSQNDLSPTIAAVLGLEGARGRLAGNCLASIAGRACSP